MIENLLSELNEKQQSAAKVLSGPLLILAGAGSGKTKTLTYRIAHLIANGTKPGSILAVTFTNKAANEMKSRLERLLGQAKLPHAGLPSVGTFHSICVRILRQEIENLPRNFTRNFVIFDSTDSKNLIKMILKELHFDEKEIKHRAVASHISSAKNQLMTPDDYAENTEMNRFTQAVQKVFPIYQRRLEEHNALDFDDLLGRTVELFESRPEVLEKFRGKWQHLMVDEYQDTNFAQYRLVRLLSDAHKNLCVIGDDHQSIYRFRGADYTNILNFEKDFPDATVVKLEQNYRSTKSILANANALIDKNETGRPKELWTENEPGEPIDVVQIYNEKAEGNTIAEKIRGFFADGKCKYQDCAILYRMNAQSRSIEEALMRNQIPYQIVGGTRFFDRKEIKDLIGYLRLIFNVRDDISFLRVINTPSRKLGKATLEMLQEFARNYTMSLFEVLEHIEELEQLPMSKRTVLADFRDMIKKLQKISAENPISITLDKLIETTDFLTYLDDGSLEGQSRQQNVRELFSVAGRYDGAEYPLAEFLEGVALIADIDNLDQKEDTVTLMTIHASKGLEFPCVFLPGWEDGVFPGNASQFSAEDLEEERRLGYVAITRAEKHCTILHTQQRTLFGKTQTSSPSQFLAELDEEYVNHSGDLINSTFDRMYSQKRSVSSSQNFGQNQDFPRKKPSANTPLYRQPKNRTEALFGRTENETGYASGERVRHPEWGDGTVIQISGDILSIAFSGQGIKKLVASIAPLEKI